MQLLEPWAEWAATHDLDPVDLGIDIMLTNRAGEYTAVQAKCYAEHNEVTTAGVDSFLARALGVNTSHSIAGTMLVTTTDQVAKNGRRKLEEAGSKVVSRYMLEDSDVEWGALFNAAFCGAEAPAARPKKTLRPYQADAVKDVITELSKTDRTQLIAACGTGKTLMGLRIAEANAFADLIIVAAPSIALVAQTAQAWVADAKLPFSTLVVCSDHTAGSTLRNTSGGDSNSKAVDNELLASVPVTVTTETEAVSEFLKTPGRKVIFTTHISTPRVIEAMAEAGAQADLLLVDEAHKIAGRSQAGPLLCFELPAKKRLFATATPRIIRGVANNGDRRYTTMDSVEQFGKEAHHISFAQAVELGALVDYEIRVVVINDDDVRATLEDADYVDLAGTEITPEEFATQVALQKHAKELGLERVVSFHRTKREARAFADSYRLVADTTMVGSVVTSETLTGNNPVRERTAALRRLRNLEDRSGQPVDQFLMTNARCLTEGIDVVSIDTVVFASSKKSTTDIVQAAGRAMRLSPTTGKAKATIVIPLYLGAGEELEVSAWGPVVDVLRAMGSADERLVDAMELAQRAGVRHRAGLDTTGWSNALTDFVTISGTQPDLAVPVVTQILDRAVGGWGRWFEELRMYVKVHGALPRGNSTSLGAWVIGQRLRYRKGAHSSEKIALLESVPGWDWAPLDNAWEQAFADLTLYLTKHGRLPTVHESSLGRWTFKQRTALRRGVLLPERKARLESLDGWEWDARAAAWNEKLSDLQVYIRENGALPPGNTCPLSTWVSSQRTRYKKGTLSEDRSLRLEVLDHWTWDGYEAVWADKVGQLRAFVAAHNALPPRNGHPLGGWVYFQRKQHHSGVLAPDRVARLEAIEGWSW